MKRFEKLKMTLFDSTNANFRLGVEGQFTRNNQDGTHRDLVFVSNKMVGYLNPNIYLTLEYKNDENPTAIYTSYPQLYKLRAAFKKVEDMILSGNAFTTVGNELKVNGKFADPVTVSEIGKNNNWISIKLCVISTDNGSVTTEPGVSIELSTAEKFLSVFNIDEFRTLYTLIKDIDLSGIAASMSIAFLLSNSDQQNGYYPAAQQPYGYQPAPQGGFVQPVAAPQQPQYQQPYGTPRPQQYQQPRYGNAPRYQQGNGQRPAPRTMAPQQQPQPARSADEPTPMMAPRAAQSRPLMNPNAVEETPVSETFYDDAQAIDEIFNEE